MTLATLKTNMLAEDFEAQKRDAVYLHLKLCNQYRMFMKEVADLETTEAFDKVAKDYELMLKASYDRLISKAKQVQQ